MTNTDNTFTVIRIDRDEPVHISEFIRDVLPHYANDVVALSNEIGGGNDGHRGQRLRTFEIAGRSTRVDSAKRTRVRFSP